MSRKLKPSYETLRKITKPVLIITKDSRKTKKYYNDRIRILYPDGKCEWDFLCGQGDFDPSCFVRPDNNLKQTIFAMEQYDFQVGIKLLEVIEL